ncbi:atherin-like [Cebus imitator]|uniref:atherin-like n=1 Tax=Cebus imitator TaxID=2715852 RepID=UPI00189975DA|nr:atherin-like [Cebus imitator]
MNLQVELSLKEHNMDQRQETFSESVEPAPRSPRALQIRVLPAAPFPGASPLPGPPSSRRPPARGSFWPRLGPRLRPPRAQAARPPRARALTRSRRVAPLSLPPGTARSSSQERGCRCCSWSGWAPPPPPLLAFPGLLVASAPAAAAAAAAACDSPPPLSFFSFCLRPLPPGVRARGLHGLLWQELARVCACVSVRVWRAPVPRSLLGSRRERAEETAAAAAARSPGPRDEAPTCPRPPGPAGELISHPQGSGLAGPRDAALGCRASALPARPRRAPGKEFAWLSLRLSAEAAGARGDPRLGENLGRTRKRTLWLRSHPWPSRLPLPIPSLPLRGGKGRTWKKKKKEKGGGVGELDIKIGWGDGGRFLVSSAASFLKRRRQQQREEEKQP